MTEESAPAEHDEDGAGDGIRETIFNTRSSTMADIRRNMLMVNTTQHTNMTRAQRGSDWEGRGKRERERGRERPGRVGRGGGKTHARGVTMSTGKRVARLAADDVTASLRHGTSGERRATPSGAGRVSGREMARYDGEESADGLGSCL